MPEKNSDLWGCLRKWNKLSSISLHYSLNNFGKSEKLNEVFKTIVKIINMIQDGNMSPSTSTVNVSFGGYGR